MEAIKGLAWFAGPVTVLIAWMKGCEAIHTVVPPINEVFPTMGPIVAFVVVCLLVGWFIALG